MERSTAYDSITNGGKSGRQWKPYSGPTLLTAGSAGIMERPTATNSITNGAYTPLTRPTNYGVTMITAGANGI